jgi:DNA polymerase-2
MEAVRYDWTPLAQSLQRELMGRMFSLQPAERIASYVEELVRSVRRGECDELLVYRKRLRKPFSSYTASVPPHVKAAALLPAEERTGTIRYIQTVDGPQPCGKLTAPPDYDHYVQRQIHPIVDTVAPVLGLPPRGEAGRERQLELF